MAASFSRYIACSGPPGSCKENIMNKLMIISLLFVGCATYDARNGFMSRCVDQMGTLEECKDSWASAEPSDSVVRSSGSRVSRPREAMYCEARCSQSGFSQSYCSDDCSTRGGWKHSSIRTIHYHSYGTNGYSSGTIIYD